jgi:hypothetical protein
MESLLKDKIEQGWVNSYALMKVRSVCCIRAPIVSLFKDKIEQGWVNSCAVIKVRSFCCTRGTYRVTVQRQDWTRLSELMCCDIGKKLKFLTISQHMSSLSLVQSCLWTVTRCVPLGQRKLLTFITAHEFTQPCSILSLNSDTICAPSAAETSYLYHSTWVHSVLFNLVSGQWHDVCPWCSRNF